MKKKDFPETSRIAGQNKSVESKLKDYDDIIRAYQHLGSGIYTDVAKFLKWTDCAKVARRQKEMREKGILINTGIKKMTPRQRPAFIHQLAAEFVRTPVQLVDDMMTLAKNKSLVNPLFNL